MSPSRPGHHANAQWLRKTGMTAEEFAAWQDEFSATWVVKNGAECKRAGLSVQAARRIHDAMADDSVSQQALGQLVTAARMADIPVNCLEDWASAGVMRAKRAPQGRVSTSAWCTNARWLLGACGGNGKLAALAAAAAVTPEELRDIRERGELNENSLRMLAAMRTALPQAGDGGSGRL